MYLTRLDGKTRPRSPPPARPTPPTTVCLDPRRRRSSSLEVRRAARWAATGLLSHSFPSLLPPSPLLPLPGGGRRPNPRVGKVGSAGWLAGSGRPVAVHRSSLLLAWAGDLAAVAAVVAATVPPRSRGRGWPAASAPTRAAGPLRRRRGLPVLVAGCLGQGVGCRRICSCQRRLLQVVSRGAGGRILSLSG